MAPKTRKKKIDVVEAMSAITEPITENIPPPIETKVDIEPDINPIQGLNIPLSDVKPKTVRKSRQTKKEEKTVEHVIVQLPISQEKIEEIVKHSAYTEGTVLQDNREPLPYSSVDHFDNLHDCVSDVGNAFDSKNTENCMKEMHPSLTTRQACYWCCHEIGAFKYGMPVSYDTMHQSFNQYGLFCSLECASAYNFSTNMGSDRMWEINTWIQLMAKKLGIETPIRAAPSRYLLQMFGGPMRIEDFRNCHKSLYRAYVMNIPPMINVSAQSEVMNVSYIYGKQNDIANDDTKSKLARKKSIMDSKKTLDAKMNLTYENISDPC